MILKMLKILLLFLFIFSACSEEVKNTESDRLKLLETDIEFSETSRVRGAAEAFKLYLTEDALQLPNNAEPILAGRKFTKICWQARK